MWLWGGQLHGDSQEPLLIVEAHNSPELSSDRVCKPNSTSSGLLHYRRMLRISSLTEPLKGHVRDQSFTDPLKTYVGCLETIQAATHSRHGRQDGRDCHSSLSSAGIPRALSMSSARPPIKRNSLSYRDPRITSYLT